MAHVAAPIRCHGAGSRRGPSAPFGETVRTGCFSKALLWLILLCGLVVLLSGVLNDPVSHHRHTCSTLFTATLASSLR